MSNAVHSNWEEANQRYLVAALGVVREHLERHTGRCGEKGASDSSPEAPQETLRQVARTMPAPSALENLATIFALSAFEQNVLLLCAGAELDSRFAALCAAAQGDVRRTYPTFSLALAALPDAHWSTLVPTRPLRYWRLIEVASGDSLTLGPLRIDERILHYLAGVNCMDERLRAYVEANDDQLDLPPSLQAVAKRIAAATLGRGKNSDSIPVIQLCGEDPLACQAVARAACEMSGMNLYVMPASTLPQAPTEFGAWIRLWEREAALGANLLLIDCHGQDATDAARGSVVCRLINVARCPMFVAARQPRHHFARPALTVDVAKPTRVEQKALWHHGLGQAVASLNGQLDAVLSEFNLGPTAIQTVTAQLRRRNGMSGETDAGDAGVRASQLATQLWDLCRDQARPRLENLAHRIEPAAKWDDLVLPATQRQTLRDIAGQVRQRFRVHETWGFASKGSRGLGISALFAGPSGTGKTMAAEVLANELRLDLYRIDLSQVVSKYIGETEKNLRRVFDAAEEGGVILFFDEADALFGKRSEVKDSHDRYANIEISYLLQRMEAFRGLAILATNLKNVLDPAFLRRIRFVVHFPFPEAADRAEIWRQVFPANTPTENLDVAKLARLNVAGGNIRNIALNAAFFASDEGQPVSMTHLLRAARHECAKLERPLSEGEIGGWV